MAKELPQKANALHPITKVKEFYTGWYREGKYRILIFYEDLSYKEYYFAIKDDYKFSIKGKDYMIVPNRIIHGKYSTLIYYYNNPMPIKFEYEYTKLTSEDLYDKEEFMKLAEDE